MRSLKRQSQATTAVHGGSTRNNRHIEAREVQMTHKEKLFTLRTVTVKEVAQRGSTGFVLRGFQDLTG